MTITAFEPNRLGLHPTQPGLPDALHERQFEPDGEGFVYRLVVEFEPRGGIAGLFDRLLLDRGIRRAFQSTFVARERSSRRPSSSRALHWESCSASEPRLQLNVLRLG